jgi:hypothetical protein
MYETAKGNTMEQNIQSQEEWVLYRLEKFYSNSNNLNRIQSIIEGKSVISLRLIDWFVTNYAKKFNTSFTTKSKKHVVVYLSYKSHLKAYSKKMFDPFCRWKRITFKDIQTTVGQLNFFEWAITDEVLDYVEQHRDEIHKDMETRIQTMKQSDTNQVKKRHEISNSATKSLRMHDTRVTVKFD